MEVLSYTDLVDEILSGEIESVSEEDQRILKENRQSVIAYLDPMISKEISEKEKEGNCEFSDLLFWGLRLAAFLKAPNTLEKLCDLCEFYDDEVEELMGHCFITEDLPYLFAWASEGDWGRLKVMAKDPMISVDIQIASLQGLVYLVAMGKVNRLEVMAFLKEFLKKEIAGDTEDKHFISSVIGFCADLWSKECLEEIQELFGLTLVDEDFIDIACVLEDFEEGQEACMDKLKKQVGSYHPLVFFHGPFDFKKSLKKFMEILEQSDVEVKKVLHEPERNDPCSCGSGKKYKKCCMHGLKVPDSIEKVHIEACRISYGPLSDPELDKLPEGDREEVLGLYHLIKEQPEKSLAKALVYIEKYPDLPMLRNYLYCAYRYLDRPREAIQVLKETVDRFPDYFFGLIEYALYFLRRGEAEKAHATIKNAFSLKQLYPEREVFHASELSSFSFFMSRFFIETNDIDQAKIQMGILKKILPDSNKIKDVERKLKGKLFTDAISKKMLTK